MSNILKVSLDFPYTLRFYVLILPLFLIFIDCKAQNENDILLPIEQTLSVAESEKITIHFKDSSSLKLSDYPNIKYSSMWPTETLRQILIDLDGDGTKELIVQHFTDGAHRSYIFNLFKRVDDNNFKEIISRENLMIEKDSILRIWLYGDLGLYHSCFGCYLKTPEYLDASIDLTYNKGELSLARDEKLNILIKENLIFLKNRGIPDMNNFHADDATRKSYLLHLVTYHFNNHCEINNTKRLFDNYYEHSDKNEIWTEIEDIIRKQEQLLQTYKNILN